MKENFQFMTLTFFKGCTLKSFNETIDTNFADDLSEKCVEIKETTLHLDRYFDPPYNNDFGEFSWWVSSNYPDLIFFSSNLIDGYYTLCNLLQSKLGCERFQWAFSNGTDYTMSQMLYTDKNGEERIVMAYRDDPRWVFYQSGKLLPFEDESNYSRRFIKKRLNFDIQKQYLSRMGISLSNIDENVTFCMTLKRFDWPKNLPLFP